jgi:hypothetical protein
MQEEPKMARANTILSSYEKCLTMARAAAAIAIVGAAMAAGADGNTDGLKRLERFVGEWRGTSRGEPGEGTVQRSCALTLNDRFLECRTTTTYPPQKKNPKGEIHVDRAFFSYDKVAKKIRLRQFHGEGFVNSYVESSPLVFTTTEIENIPAGWRARETYEQPSPDSWTERFDLAQPGQELELYSSSVLERVK